MVKVSICIPAYNNEQALRRLLESVEKQTFQDYEVIITDDSDSEGVRKLAEEKPYVRYYKNKVRLGSTANWNEAVGKGTGEYIKIMHHDDWFTGADSLQSFVTMMEQHPEADLVFSGTMQCGDNTPRHISGEDAGLIREDYRNLFLGNTIGSPSAVMVRRKDKKAASSTEINYDEKLKWLVDMEYYMQILKENPEFAYTDEPLVSIGIGETQLTEECRDDVELNVFEYGYIYDKYRLETEKRYRKKLQRLYADAGMDYTEARKHGITKNEYRFTRIKKFASCVKWKAEAFCGRAGILFFYLCITLEILLVIVDKSNYTNPLEGQLFRITFLLAALKILCTRYSNREWVTIFLFGILGFISYRVTGRNEIIRIVAFIAACKGVEMKKALKYVFFTTAAGCLVLVTLSVTGIYGGLYLEADFGREYVQRRYCLGLGHPNALHCMFFMLAALGLYLYQERMRWYGYLLLFLANLGLYALTDSNTGMLMTACTIGMAVFFRYWKKLKEKKWVYLVGMAVFFICVLFSVAAASESFTKPDMDAVRNPHREFGNPLIQAAEERLNGRIIDLYYGTRNQEGTVSTWSLFSNPENTQYFDMGFVRIFYWYGILPGIVYIILTGLLFWQCYRKKDSMGLVLLVVFSVYTVVEAHLVSVYIGRNYILFLMGMYFSDMLPVRSKKEAYLWDRKIR